MTTAEIVSFDDVLANFNAMYVKRTKNEEEVINAVSDYITRLDIDKEQNDTLVKIMTRMVNIIEKEQFCEGVLFALKLTRETGIDG
jgi:hypothetical protein